MQKAERYQLDKSQICRSAGSQFASSEGKVKLRFINNASSLWPGLTTEVTCGVGGGGGGGRVVIIS